MTATIDFALPGELEAREPPESRGIARDAVRMLVSRSHDGSVSHRGFGSLPSYLLPGDLLVVNNSATLPAAVRALDGRVVHFSGQLPDGCWLVELRVPAGNSTEPAPFADPSPPPRPALPGGVAPTLALPGGATLTLIRRQTARLWRARMSVAVRPYLLRHGSPIRYSYASADWPLAAYQTVFASVPGSAEMPSAARPFSASLVTALVSRGITIAPVTLHCGVSSLEAGEDPYPEQFEVPPATARLVNLTRSSGGRVIAAGTTVVRAIESAVADDQADGPARAAPAAAARVQPKAGWTSLVVTPESGVRAVDGLLTGLHEPRSTHLWMLRAFAGADLLRRCYDEALARGYLWHEFGDVHLMLP